MTIIQKAPGKFSRRRAQRIATAGLFLVALCSLALADDPIFRVARISLVEGEVSYQRANDSRKDWFDATLNQPLDESDQLYSGSDGRAEIQLSGRNIVRIDRDTNLRFTQFNTGVIQMSLPIGSAYFRIDSLDKRQFQVVDANDAGVNDPVYFEVDTPTVAVTFTREGVYRLNVRDDGSTEVIVRQGQAEVYNQEIGTIIVKKGRRIIVEANDAFYRVASLEDKDNWDRWNDRRDDDLFARMNSSHSARYIPVAIPGVYDLDNYGEWIEMPEYGWMWCPRGVAPGWAPYRDGYWRWYPLYGWTWISYEPWGWAPYHYGRWAYVRNRWRWAPFVNIGLGFDWRWRPHHVVFFGWGGRYNRGYTDGYYDGYWDGFRDGQYGWLAWCPLSPRDRHYGPRRNAPRLEALGNFREPGGVSGTDARRFSSGRVVVSRDVLNAPVPPREVITAPLRGERGGERGPAAPALVRNEDLKPRETVAPTRNDTVARGRVARRIEAPVIMRRIPVDASGAIRSRDGAASGSLPTRDGRARDGRTAAVTGSPVTGRRRRDEAMIRTRRRPHAFQTDESSALRARPITDRLSAAPRRRLVPGTSTAIRLTVGANAAMKATIRRETNRLRAAKSDPMTLRDVTIRLRVRASSGAKRHANRRLRERFAEPIRRRRTPHRRHEASRGHHRRRLKAPRRGLHRLLLRRSGHHRRRLKAPRPERQSDLHRLLPRRSDLHRLLPRRSDLRRLLPPAKALLHARRNRRLTAQCLRAGPVINSGISDPFGRDCSPKSKRPAIIGWPLRLRRRKDGRYENRIADDNYDRVILPVCRGRADLCAATGSSEDLFHYQH